MLKVTKLLNILTIVMFAITAVLIGLFVFGGEVPNSQYSSPVYTDELIWWAYILLALTAVAAFVFPIGRLISNPKQALKTLIAVVGVCLLVLIAYSLSDGTIMNLPGYDGADNVEGTLKFADTMLFTMYFLGIGAILAIIVTEIIRRFR